MTFCMLKPLAKSVITCFRIPVVAAHKAFDLDLVAAVACIVF